MSLTLGHQTIRKTTETVAQRKAKGPIQSFTHDRNGNPKNKPPFAGNGYYFWDDNIEAAHKWGDLRCGGHYRIFGIDIDLAEDDTYLDLVGNRQHLQFFATLINKVKLNLKEKCQGWMLHHFIDHLRKNNFFPFKLIRFNDDTMSNNYQTPLVMGHTRDRENVLLLNPFFILCVFRKEDLRLNTYKFIDES